MKSQLQHYMESHRRVANINKMFMQFVRDGLTRSELRQLIQKRPEIWGRFEHWLDKLPK